MLHKKLLIPLLLLFLLTPLIISADTAPKEPHNVQVIIESRPDLAEVWIDGKFVGSTSLAYRLAPGDHKIELVRPRHATWTRTLTVAPGQPTRVAALLQESSDKPCQ